MSDRDELKQDNERGATPTARSRAKRAACPICGKPPASGHEPFCSARCADVDLNRWLTGSYVIPGRPIDEIEDD